MRRLGRNILRCLTLASESAIEAVAEDGQGERFDPSHILRDAGSRCMIFHVA
jgi:hypothetical protein